MRIKVTFSAPAKYHIGLHDCESADYNYQSRNLKDSIPEVIKLGNGDACPLTEPVEWLWYWAWAHKYPSLVSSGESLKIWRVNMRDNAAFTNKFGSTSKRSWVLGTNPSAEPMRSEGVDCPGGNLFRSVSDKIYNIGSRDSLAVWCLDYNHLKSLSVAEAKALAITLPGWLLHVAQNVHPDASFSSWDYDFTVPMLASDTSEETAIVDGFRCRRNYMRLSRLR